MFYSTPKVSRDVEPVKREGWRRRRQLVEEREEQRQEEEQQREEEQHPRRNRVELLESLELLDDLALFWLDEFGDPDEAEHLFPDFEDNGAAEVDYGLLLRQPESHTDAPAAIPQNSAAVDDVALMRLRYWSA